ncbi:MAG TPA: polysaccharide deacetylase family protein, partial [Pyrinomonadaceae bacterium]|nr:polysaccharide deacetylase family protein [Pyrinomonadaceae bacterium]
MARPYFVLPLLVGLNARNADLGRAYSAENDIFLRTEEAYRDQLAALQRQRPRIEAEIKAVTEHRLQAKMSGSPISRRYRLVVTSLVLIVYPLESGNDTKRLRSGAMLVRNIRRVLGQVIGATLVKAGFVSWSIATVRSAGLVTHVYFHRPSAAVFRDCISWLLRRGYRALATAELEEAILNDRELPPLSLHISFDDAWRSNLTEVVPVAESLDIPITIFVPTEPILCGHYWWTSVESVARDQGRTVEWLKRVPDEERRAYVKEMTRESKLPREAMTLEELRSIARLSNVTIGSHTLTHPILPNCSDSVLEREVAESKFTLEHWLGMSVTSFAYPNGDFGERECRAVQRAGYRTAFTALQQHEWP